MVAAVVVLVGSLIASGLVYDHKRVLTYLGLAGVLWQVTWLTLTFLERVVFPAETSAQVLFIGSFVFLISALITLRFRSIRLPFGRGHHDLVGEGAIMLVLLVVLGAASLIWRVNGFQDHAWITHGFFNGDTVTFMALTQRSLNETGLVQQNPFNANESLEYPTLLHAGMANIFRDLSEGSGWLYFLPTLTYIWIFITVPMFFLLWEVVIGKTVASLWQQLLIPSVTILYLAAVSWDTYIYPQSHFFLTGLFLFDVFCFTRAFSTLHDKRLLEILGALTTVILLLSNAISGTVAVALAVTYCLLRRQPYYLCAAIIFIALFFVATPGNAAFGWPHFSYTAGYDMLRLSPIVAVILAAAFWKRVTLPHISAAITVITGLAFVTFFFSQRNIVVENASRFFYHGALVGFPLVGMAIPLLWSYVKRVLRGFQISSPQSIITLFLLLGAVGLLLLPAGTSVVSAHDNLMRKDTQDIDTATRLGLWWIEDNTTHNAVFLASPEAPFAIPAFTGRSLLRTNYWLSQQDSVFADIEAAFRGDKAAQEQVLPAADYVFLTAKERASFEPLPDSYTKVFDSRAIVIYEIPKQ
ncbi:MAG: hypothetical protein HYR90_03280 [Candidatus Andersenbacteria bacterium]|nr:hypothetical protein [Candidatus Andersenbacteria bacterium]MBI3250287.1 hypothetical protein [Candidatus Andersenbacteria bacterium]